MASFEDVVDAVPTTTGPLFSNEHIRFNGLSMVWPLCWRASPLTTSSWPLMCLRMRPFFHSPLFFSSPTINTTSLTSGQFLAPLLMRWLSIDHERIFSFSVATHVAYSHFMRVQLGRSISFYCKPCFSTACASWLQSNRSGIRTCSSPSSLSTYVSGQLFSCCSMSVTTDSTCSYLKLVLPMVLWNIFILDESRISLPTMAI